MNILIDHVTSETTKGLVKQVQQFVDNFDRTKVDVEIQYQTVSVTAHGPDGPTIEYSALMIARWKV
jgi:hypothetical protein